MSVHNVEKPGRRQIPPPLPRRVAPSVTLPRREKVISKLLSANETPLAAKTSYLAEIAGGEIVFQAATVEHFRPVITALLAIPELKGPAQAALDKLFPPPAEPEPESEAPTIFQEPEPAKPATPPPAQKDEGDGTEMIRPGQLNEMLTQAAGSGRPTNPLEEKAGGLIKQCLALQEGHKTILAEISFKNNKAAQYTNEIGSARKRIEIKRQAFKLAIAEAKIARKKKLRVDKELADIFREWQQKKNKAPLAFDERDLTFEELKRTIHNSYGELDGIINRMNKELDLPAREIEINNKQLQITALDNEITALREKAARLAVAITEIQPQLKEQQAALRGQIARIREEQLDPLEALEKELTGILTDGHKE